MSWTVRAVQLPDGDRPVELWVDAAGCLVTEPVPGADRLPGRYVAPGLVDAHAHPAVGREAGMPVALNGSETLNVLAAWAACGVGLVRDTGSAGGSVLQLDLVPGMPRLQAAGRFLAPPGRYFPALLPEAAPQEQLAELAVGELARSAPRYQPARPENDGRGRQGARRCQLAGQDAGVYRPPALGTHLSFCWAWQASGRPVAHVNGTLHRGDGDQRS
jgi:hypothetical protein